MKILARSVFQIGWEEIIPRRGIKNAQEMEASASCVAINIKILVL
jgi:hypothetical protein